jgi:hypothetical protein
VLVGENASGKSTVLEVLAAALGLNAEGGSRNTRLITRPGQPGSLDLIVERSPGADRWPCFLIAGWRQFLGDPHSFLRYLT